MIDYKPIIQPISVSGYNAGVLRLDQLHPEISGNKWFKLKYNLQRAIDEHANIVLTFGGAFSNHLAATAAACKQYNLKSIGIVRGEEPAVWNETLIRAGENGMQLHFVSREDYKRKEEEPFKQQLLGRFGPHYLIPEGGNNVAGLLGCKEILAFSHSYDLIFCACGTATTFAGLVSSAKAHQTVIGISVLKGENTLPEEAMHLLEQALPGAKFKIYGNEGLAALKAGQHCISNAYSFSGYAKCDPVLIEFKKQFEKQQNIPLDYVYTSKLMYAVLDLIKSKKIKPEQKILIIHSGGLQGNAGFETRYHLSPIA